MQDKIEVPVVPNNKTTPQSSSITWDDLFGYWDRMKLKHSNDPFPDIKDASSAYIYISTASLRSTALAYPRIALLLLSDEDDSRVLKKYAAEFGDASIEELINKHLDNHIEIGMKVLINSTTRDYLKAEVNENIYYKVYQAYKEGKLSNAEWNFLIDDIIKSLVEIDKSEANARFFIDKDIWSPYKSHQKALTKIAKRNPSLIGEILSSDKLLPIVEHYLPFLNLLDSTESHHLAGLKNSFLEKLHARQTFLSVNEEDDQHNLNFESDEQLQQLLFRQVEEAFKEKQEKEKLEEEQRKQALEEQINQQQVNILTNYATPIVFSEYDYDESLEFAYIDEENDEICEVQEKLKTNKRSDIFAQISKEKQSPLFFQEKVEKTMSLTELLNLAKIEADPAGEVRISFEADTEEEQFLLLLKDYNISKKSKLSIITLTMEEYNLLEGDEDAFYKLLCSESNNCT